MNGRQWFVALGALAVGIYLYKRFLNPRCGWCGAALQVVAAGQTLACPSCGRVTS